MVPIVEPEVLMDGEHSAKKCYEKTSEVIKKCFEELILHKVDLKGIILKPVSYTHLTLPTIDRV